MKNKNLLTHTQCARLSRKALAALSIAQTMAKCLPEELGTQVAEDFAESAIESASEALALLCKIKCSLRVERAHKLRGVETNALNFAHDQLQECARFFLGRGPMPTPEKMASIIGVCVRAKKGGAS